MNANTERIYHEWHDWLRNDERRVNYEWSVWDGTEGDGIAINDRQCERIMKARAKLGIDAAMMAEFRAHERARYEAVGV